MHVDVNKPEELEHHLWDQIEQHHTGMLWPVSAQPIHAQPMTAFAESGNRQLWFFTRRDNDLIKQVGAGGAAMFSVQYKELQACLSGMLSLQNDPDRIEKYWNAVVAAWYPQGKSDPNLALLRLDLHDAQVWVSEGGPVKFAWEIAKANATHKTPDVGDHGHLSFH